ncbi:MAG: XRE family transcriptional regulator [Victivallales bacterium]|nr:XRE family transcriptional regulator [Victivallales bacterium]MCF7889100.1 XRE family transcriptional regulator [Victivallales bacterium]
MDFNFEFLRNLRQKAGLNISDLSELSGVSPAVISKLERNICKAELETIYRISGAFGQSVSEFLALAELKSAHKRKEFKRELSVFTFREIKYGSITCLLGKAEAGDRLTKSEKHKNSDELCWVLQGEINFSLPKETYQLKKGESIQFDGKLEHTFEAVKDSEILIIHLLKERRRF